jgi:hypothetical protein
MKININYTLQRFFAAFLLSGLIIFAGTTKFQITAQAISEGYISDVSSSLQKGHIVAIDQNNPRKVILARNNNSDKTIGVVVERNDSPVTISSPEQEVFVTKNGPFDALVSTQGGAINIGDYIAVSAIEGVGMRANPKDAISIGRAIQSFDGQTGVKSTATIKDANGADLPVTIGRVSIDVTVGKNPLYEPEKTKGNIPTWLKKFADTVAGKPVSPIRIYASLTVFLLLFAVAATLLYASVKSSIIAIGRNPLGKSQIIKSLTQVIITSIIILLVAIGAVYLLLKV